MKFIEERNRNRIRSCNQTTITVNENRYTLPIVLHLGRIDTAIEPIKYQDFDLPSARLIIQQEPEIVLLGSGASLVFPSREVRYLFLNAGIGLEVMDTAAACRTYNILIGEDRNVLALLYPAK